MTITVVKPESMKLQKTFSGNNKGTIFETATNEELCINLESLGIESLQITITHD